MNELLRRLAKAEIASCLCLTMTADPAMHKDDCKYKLFAEAGNALRELTTRLEAAKQIPVPEGYRLVSLKHLQALLDSITGSCYLGEDVEIKTIKAMIATGDINDNNLSR